jgi:class 3 adenylate cyclase
MSAISEVSLLVVFTNFTRFASQIERLDDMEVARVMGEYYTLAERAFSAANGRVVKFIGDATLAVFPVDAIDRGVQALLQFKPAADRFMEERGWDCRLVIKAHYGTVAAGDMGAGATSRFDVLGKSVSVAARLEGSGVVLSVEAFRQLGSETRHLFKKHTPPVTYIRQEDAHRPSRTR